MQNLLGISFKILKNKKLIYIEYFLKIRVDNLS